MMQHHKYSLTELENMLPWEREIYVGLLKTHVEEENRRIEKENKRYKKLKMMGSFFLMVEQLTET